MATSARSKKSARSSGLPASGSGRSRQRRCENYAIRHAARPSRIIGLTNSLFEDPISMFFIKVMAVLLAAILPTPSSAPHEPKTIITVISSPYCRSLADHFNGALVPMLANDRTLDGVSVQLDDLD